MSAVPDSPLPEGVTARRIAGLAVLDAASDEPSACVVLVPGFTGSKEDFRFVLAPLAGRGFRAVALDLRGQHDSPGPDDADAYSVEALAADLLAVVADLGCGPVHVVGHSFGGLVARAAVVKDPSAFRSLALMDSGPSGLRGSRADVLPYMKQILASDGLLAVWEASQALPTAKAQPPDVLAFLKRRFLAGVPAALHGMGDALTSEPDRVDELAATGLPILVLYGEADDAWSPQQQDEMAARLRAPVAVIAGSVHSPAAENPAATVDALVRFWT